jgi:hypothetical protein
MKCPDCDGKGFILAPIDMRTMGEKRCETCGGTGTLPDDDLTIEEKLGLLLEQSASIMEAIRHIQVQNRSLFYRPDIHGRLVYGFKGPFKAGLRLYTMPGAGLYRKAVALWHMWRAFKSCSRLPKPTAQNVGKPNSRVFCNIRDYFFLHIYGIPFLKELEIIVDAFIRVYDTDFYSPFINVWVDALRDAESWLPNGPSAPDHHYWKYEK